MSSSSPSPGAPGPEPSPLADPARWAALIEEVRPEAFLVVIASSMGKSLREKCAPEDIWQETLAQAWAAREQYRWNGSAAFRAWLFEIARNRIRDAARRAQAEKRGAGQAGVRIAEPASDSGSGSGIVPPDSVTPSRTLMRAERAAAIEAALGALPAELEPIVRMHLLEDLPMEAVAARLGIGLSAAWHRFRKGSELYSKALASWEGGSRG